MAIRLFRVFVEVDRPIINGRLTLNIVYTSAIRLPNRSLNSVEKTLSALLRSRIKMLGVRIGKLKTRKTTENWKIFRTLSQKGREEKGNKKIKRERETDGGWERGPRISLCGRGFNSFSPPILKQLNWHYQFSIAVNMALLHDKQPSYFSPK